MSGGGEESGRMGDSEGKKGGAAGREKVASGGWTAVGVKGQRDGAGRVDGDELKPLVVMWMVKGPCLFVEGRVQLWKLVEWLKVVRGPCLMVVLG